MSTDQQNVLPMSIISIEEEKRNKARLANLEKGRLALARKRTQSITQHVLQQPLEPSPMENMETTFPALDPHVITEVKESFNFRNMVYGFVIAAATSIGLALVSSACERLTTYTFSYLRSYTNKDREIDDIIMKQEQLKYEMMSKQMYR